MILDVLACGTDYITFQERLREKLKRTPKHPCPVWPDHLQTHLLPAQRDGGIAWRGASTAAGLAHEGKERYRLKRPHCLAGIYNGNNYPCAEEGRTGVLAVHPAQLGRDTGLPVVSRSPFGGER